MTMSISYRRSLLRALLSLGVVCIAALLTSRTAHAEGSRELTADPDGYRPYLLWQPGANTGGIINAETFRVFAQPGEVINMGSSAVGRGAGLIQYRPPAGGAFIPCPLTVGIIQNRAQEVTGPLPAVGGYDPCAVTVGAGEGGVWEVQFISPAPAATGNPPLSQNNTVWALGPDTPAVPDTAGQPGNSRWIRAWDITVTAAGVQQTGRVYANFLPLNLGANRANTRVMTSQLYVYSEDGYLYRVDTNGIDPFGFHFFSNNRGFTNAADEPLYQSVQFPGPNPGVFPPGIGLLNPTVPDDRVNNNVTHKIFFNVPAFAVFETLPFETEPNNHYADSGSGRVYFVTPPPAPPTPQNFTFEGIEGTDGAAGTNPLGGYFNFETTQTGPYSIVLDTDRNGVFGDNNDRVLLGTARPGLNRIYWDGMDQSGVRVPAGGVAYQVELVLYGGEVHFPFFDAENNLDGIRIVRLRDPGTATNPPSIYEIRYNDRYNYTGDNEYDFSMCATGDAPPPPATANIAAPLCYGTATDARTALLGVSSEFGAHRWIANYGDRRGIDTWAYYPSNPVRLPNGVLVRQADLAITKTHQPQPITPGGPITYTIQVTNLGPDNAPGARVIDTLPPEVRNPRWTCRVAVGTGACSVAGPVAGNIDTLVDVNVGDVIEIIVTGRVAPDVTAPFANTASVLRPDDITDPDDPNRQGAGNNSATTIATLGDPGDPNDPILTPTPFGTPSPSDPVITKQVQPPFALPGDTVTYTIVVRNPGPGTATNILVVDDLPRELEIVSARASRGRVQFGGQNVRLTLDSLGPGESVTVTLVVRVRPTVAVPFSILNLASLTTDQVTTPRTTSVRLLSVGSLPATGETPFWHSGLLLLALAASLSGAWWALRQRQKGRMSG